MKCLIRSDWGLFSGHNKWDLTLHSLSRDKFISYKLLPTPYQAKHYYFQNNELLFKDDQIHWG